MTNGLITTIEKQREVLQEQSAELAIGRDKIELLCRTVANLLNVIEESQIPSHRHGVASAKKLLNEIDGLRDNIWNLRNSDGVISGWAGATMLEGRTLSASPDICRDWSASFQRLEQYALWLEEQIDADPQLLRTNTFAPLF